MGITSKNRLFVKGNLSCKACEVALVVHTFKRVTTSARKEVSTQQTSLGLNDSPT